MPVARSDPRRAVVVGIAGVAIGVAMIVAVLIANSASGTKTVRSSPSATEFDAGRTEDLARAVERDRTPILFQDPARFTRPIWLQHAGGDPGSGWTAFDAAVGGCATTWDRDAQRFTDCNGRTYPADGSGLRRYIVVVKDGRVIINLDPEATTTTAPPPTTTTLPITN